MAKFILNITHRNMINTAIRDIAPGLSNDATALNRLRAYVSNLVQAGLNNSELLRLIRKEVEAAARAQNVIRYGKSIAPDIFETPSTTKARSIISMIQDSSRDPDVDIPKILGWTGANPKKDVDEIFSTLSGKNKPDSTGRSYLSGNERIVDPSPKKGLRTIQADINTGMPKDLAPLTDLEVELRAFNTQKLTGIPASTPTDRAQRLNKILKRYRSGKGDVKKLSTQLTELLSSNMTADERMALGMGEHGDDIGRLLSEGMEVLGASSVGKRELKQDLERRIARLRAELKHPMRSELRALKQDNLRALQQQMIGLYPKSERFQMSTMHSMYTSVTGDRLDEEVFDRYVFPAIKDEKKQLLNYYRSLRERALGHQGKIEALIQDLIPVELYKELEDGTKVVAYGPGAKFIHEKFGLSQVIDYVPAGDRIDEAGAIFESVQNESFPRILFQPVSLFPEEQMGSIRVAFGGLSAPSADKTPLPTFRRLQLQRETNRYFQYTQDDQTLVYQQAFDDMFQQESGRISARIRGRILGSDSFARNEQVILDAIAKGITPDEYNLLKLIGVDPDNITNVENIASEIIASLIYGDPRQSRETVLGKMTRYGRKRAERAKGINLDVKVDWEHVRRQLKETDSPFSKALSEIIEEQFPRVANQSRRGAYMSFAEGFIPKHQRELMANVQKLVETQYKLRMQQDSVPGVSYDDRRALSDDYFDLPWGERDAIEEAGGYGGAIEFEEEKPIRAISASEAKLVERNEAALLRRQKIAQEAIDEIVGQDAIVGSQLDIVSRLEQMENAGEYLSIELPGIGTGAHADILKARATFQRRKINQVTLLANDIALGRDGNLTQVGDSLLDENGLPRIVLEMQVHEDDQLAFYTRKFMMEGHDELTAGQKASEFIRMGGAKSQGIEFGLRPANVPDPAMVTDQQLLDRFDSLLRKRMVSMSEAQKPQAARMYDLVFAQIMDKRVETAAGEEWRRIEAAAIAEGKTEEQARKLAMSARHGNSLENYRVQLYDEVEYDALQAVKNWVGKDVKNVDAFVLEMQAPTSASDVLMDVRYLRNKVLFLGSQPEYMEALEAAAESGPNRETIFRNLENAQIIESTKSFQGSIFKNGRIARAFRGRQIKGIEGGSVIYGKPIEDTYDAVFDDLFGRIQRRAADSNVNLTSAQWRDFLQELTEQMSGVNKVRFGGQGYAELWEKIDPNFARIFAQGEDVLPAQIFPTIRNRRRQLFPGMYRDTVEFTGPLSGETRIFLRGTGVPSRLSAKDLLMGEDGVVRVAGKTDPFQSTTIGEALGQAVAFNRMTPKELERLGLEGRSGRILEDVAGGILDYVELLMDEQVYGSLPPEAQERISSVITKHLSGGVLPEAATAAASTGNIPAGPGKAPGSGVVDDILEEAEKASKAVDFSQILKHVKDSPFLKASAIGVAALSALGIVGAVTHRKDHTPEDAQGPPNLPGGSPYDSPNRPRGLGGPISSFRTGGNPTGMTYQVRARGNFEPSKLQQALSLLTGGSVSGTINNVSPPPSLQNIQQNINDIMDSY